jgi:hypothetical protein
MCVDLAAEFGPNSFCVYDSLLACVHEDITL